LPQPLCTLPDVLEFPYSGNQYHPTQKPVAPLRQIIETFCPLGGMVVDPFAGSGTTCVAAALSSRHFYGIELDEANHSAALSRVARVREHVRTGQLELQPVARGVAYVV
jgi:adenine-specific DNA-methyltransferase